MASITRDQLIVDMAVLMENGHTPRVANATKGDYDKGWTKATMAAAHALNVDLSSYSTYNNIFNGIFNVIDEVNRYVSDKRNGAVNRYMPEASRLHPVKGAVTIQEIVLPGLNAPPIPHVGGPVVNPPKPVAQQAVSQPAQGRPPFITNSPHNHAPGPVNYKLHVVDRMSNLLYHLEVTSPTRLRSSDVVEIDHGTYVDKLVVVWADGDNLKVRHYTPTVLTPKLRVAEQPQQPQPKGHPEFQKLAKLTS